MRGAFVGIVGPTATGKTSVGVELGELLNGEIISADSMAVYKGMDIGTAKPTAEQRERVPFHLIDVVEPNEDFSVAKFKRLAETAIADIIKRGRLPLVVGGTGLYIRALTGGLNIPETPPDWEFRERLKAEAEQFGGEYLLERLREVDPITAERLHANDIKRIIRALEVHAKTGAPISRFHATEATTETAYEAELFSLTMSRPTLYKRIEDRIDDQIKQGLVEEVKGLLEKGYDPDLPAMKGLGYKQITEYLLGNIDLQTAVEVFKRDTRRFAKRQFTWFRAESRIQWIDAENRNANEIAAEVAGMLKQKPAFCKQIAKGGHNE